MCKTKDEAQSKMDRLLASLERVADAVEESNRLARGVESGASLDIVQTITRHVTSAIASGKLDGRLARS